MIFYEIQPNNLAIGVSKDELRLFLDHLFLLNNERLVRIGRQVCFVEFFRVENGWGIKKHPDGMSPEEAQKYARLIKVKYS